MSLPISMVKKHQKILQFLRMEFSIKSFMNDGLMTGIFLDQHEVRGSLVDGLAMGKSLLNMFPTQQLSQLLQQWEELVKQPL